MKVSKAQTEAGLRLGGGRLDIPEIPNRLTA
jgi:hypothetical protein